MSLANLGNFTWSKWQSQRATTGVKEIGTSGSHLVVKGVIVNSHTSSTFTLANGTATSYTTIQGSYTPASGSSSILFEPIDLTNGGVIVIQGAADYTVLYNDFA